MNRGDVVVVPFPRLKCAGAVGRWTGSPPPLQSSDLGNCSVVPVRNP
jgi:hypothetical protein